MDNKTPEVNGRIVHIPLGWGTITRIIQLPAGRGTRVSIAWDTEGRILDGKTRHETIVDWAHCLVSGNRHPFSGVVLIDPRG